MRRIFLDTNILLDVAMHRNDFCEQSAAVWADCELKKVQGFVSAISLNNMHYVIKKHVEPAAALEYVRHVLNIFTVVPLDESILRLAVDLPHKDFEDAIQYYTSQENGINILLTRNLRDYKNASLIVQTPETFLVSNGLI